MLVNGIKSCLDALGHCQQTLFVLASGLIGGQEAGLHRVNQRGCCDGRCAAIGGNFNCCHALGDIISSKANLVDDFIQVQVERTEAGAFDVPVSLLALK